VNTVGSTGPHTHIIIPDTQARPNVPNDHLQWIGEYIASAYGGRKNVTVIHLGDHWDMPSLSHYDRGKLAMEGRRYVEDVEAGNFAMQLLDEAMRVPRWKPRKVFLFGNHEDRITRAAEDNAQLEGAVTLDHLRLDDWETHAYLDPTWIDGVCYAHYFYNPMTGRPYGGQNVETRLKTIGHSFTMGHQQGLLYGLRSTLAGMQHGLVAGSAYIHDETYKGFQGNSHWRGIIVAHQVAAGSYDPMFVSLDYLCRRSQGKPLVEWAA
jgi:hypothetical protein